MLSGRRNAVLPLLGAAACALLAAAVVSLVYLDGGAQRLDATALHGFNTLEDGVLYRPALFLAVFGGYLPLFPGLPLLYLAGQRWGRRRQALAGILVILASGASSEILKVLLSHPRIQPILGPHQVNAASFPSGTAAMVMAMAVAALLVAPARWRLQTAVAGALFVFAVTSSVMILLWHFPSDVLGGILVAVGYGFVAVAALRHQERHGTKRPVAAIVARRPGHGSLKAAAVTLVVAVFSVWLMFSAQIAAFAADYTTSAVTGLAIAGTAVTLLVAFGVVAPDDA